ncbi:septal ring lytic transglycosylase RlpA family protein [Luteimonas vadosa]|uniref:Endolytic peptidoglycan transglycosylase RlpA n=1 Tax=Luteimonas vadosa TaxID=1165507 RepID=A0ABP9DTF9_9GAMM
MSGARVGRFLLAGSLLALAACSSAPKQPDPPPPQASAPAPATPAGRKVSPYAPAREDPGKRGDYVAGGLYAPGVKDSIPQELPDVDAIPEPDVVDEPRARYGNRSPYTVLGKHYTVLDRPDGYVEQGLASYYGNKFHGRRTSSQEVYDMYAFTAAHRSLPLPSFARVTNLDNGRSVVVRVNDRGPFHEGRVIDLSFAAAVKLGIHPRGTGLVEVRGLTPRDVPRSTTVDTSTATVDPSTGLPPGVRVATGRPQPMPPTPIDDLVATLPAADAQTMVAASTVAEGAGVPVAVETVAAADARDWRFDMLQDGRAMTADEFDAWMKARRARVATGKPGKPDPYGAAAPGAVSPVAQAGPPATVGPPIAAERAAAPAARLVEPVASNAPGVMLQVAAFGARANAERALAMLRDAGVAGARLMDGVSDGKPVWRLRVGPLDAASVTEFSTRVAALGFGMPHVVRE